MSPLRSARALAATLALASLASWAWPASAHHGWSGYEETPRSVTGVLRAVDYRNPHVTVTLEADGRTLRVVLAPPSRMERRGLPKEDLVVGESATVEAYAHEEHRDELRAEWIEVRGRRTELR